jgi:hypothetical protein
MLGILVAFLAFFVMGSVSAFADGAVMQLPSEDQQVIAAKLGPGVVGKALPSKPMDEPSIYFPLQNRTPAYVVTSGPHAGKTQKLGLASARRPGGKAAWRFQLSPTLAGFIRMTPENDLVMPAVSDTGEGVVVVTTPANPFLPKGMMPGETRSFSQTVSVDHLDDPTDKEYSGSISGSTRTLAPTK